MGLYRVRGTLHLKPDSILIGLSPAATVLVVNGDHPLMLPSKLANRKIDVQFMIWNSDEPLYTMPVGAPRPFPDEDRVQLRVRSCRRRLCTRG